MNTLTEPLRPHVVGGYVDHGEAKFLPASRQEIERGADAMARVISTFPLPPGAVVVLISTLEQSVQVGPLEQACIDLGLVVATADCTPFDAGRVEALMRRFDVAAAFGVSAAILDGLDQLGCDLAKVFAGAVVWARADAYPRLRRTPGLTVRRWVDAGPALALECVADRGPHLDAREWEIGSEGGEIVLSSRLPRALHLVHASTGLRGALCLRPCSCGNADPVVDLAEPLG